MAILAAVLTFIGPCAALPAAPLRLVVGVLTLMFGLRWFRKAVLRAAGLIPLHDEAAEYDRTRARLGTRLRDARGGGWDGVALVAAFQVVMMEGFEVVLIVVAVGAGGGALLPASWGAGAALLTVMLLGVALHRPITRVPENALKFCVGVMLSAFGVFWTGEGLGVAWPGDDLAIPALIGLFLAAALVLVRIVRSGMREVLQ